MASGRTGRSLRYALTLIAAVVLVFATAGAASAQGGIPGGITEQSDSVNFLWLVVGGLAIAVFVLVAGALLYAVIRFRRRSDDDPLPPQTHGNTAIEIVWVAIPVIIVIFLFTISLVALLDIEEDAEADALTVEVQGFRWDWAFIYDLSDLGPASDLDEEGTIQVRSSRDPETNERIKPVLRIPAGEDVEFLLRANDVIHSFYVREFLYKLDVVPGRDNSFKVTPKVSEIGTYHGQCAEYCGTDHAFMDFTLMVVSREDFDAWIAEEAAAQGLIDAPEQVQASE